MSRRGLWAEGGLGQERLRERRGSGRSSAPCALPQVPQDKEEPLARGCSPRAGDTPGGPRGPPEPAPAGETRPRPGHAPGPSCPAHSDPASPGQSPRKPRLPGAAPQPPPERDIGTNQLPASPTASSDWLPSAAGPEGTASAPTSNEASRRRAGAGGRGWAREGAAGRPIRITLLQASF